MANLQRNHNAISKQNESLLKQMGELKTMNKEDGSSFSNEFVESKRKNDKYKLQIQ
jgi:hypothetical protein